MPTTAEELLSALEPLPFPARLTLTARTAHRLADEGRLAPLLAGLDARGSYERRLAALAALAGRDAGFLAERLADPDAVVAGYALRAARTLPVPDEAVEAAYEDAPAVLRHRLARVLAHGGRSALAERLVARLGEQWGDAEAARLLPACSTAFVARELPRLAHAVEAWTTLAQRHPDAVVDHCERALAERPDAWRQEEWWRLNATTVAALAPRRPERVLALLEQYGPPRLPPVLYCGLGPLITADVERVIRWITSPERRENRHEPLPPPGVLRRLVRADPRSLPELGRHWEHRAHLTALLKAMAPGRRAAFLDTVTGGWTDREPSRSELELLPRERRWAEVRRAAAEFDDPDDFWEDLHTLAHGPYAEARSALLAAAHRPDPDDREAAWAMLVRCAARDGGREAITGMLDELVRLRNERDPVRAQALAALAAVRPRLFGPDHAASLDRIAVDALQARDCSAGTLAAVRTLAGRVLAEHSTAADPALRAWALGTLERLVGRFGVPDLGPLHRVLRRGQEHEVFEALRPWLRSAADRSDFRLVVGLAEALGPRARRMPELQDLLALAVERGDDTTFEAAAKLWLAAPATRAERVARIVALEPSAVVLPPVRAVLARRRTDLLDALLADEPPYGRFLVQGARRPLPDLAAADRWLPRQQRAAAHLAGRTAADGSLPSDDRAAAIRAAAPVPELGHALAMRYKDDDDVVVAEAAFAALAWTDRPQEALPVLLEQAAGDRARVAVYAAGRVAHFAAPAELARALGALLTGERAAKVTARKEAVRLATRFLPRRQAVALLAGAFRAPDSHPDVRAAVVRSLPPLLGVPETWDLLAEAAHDEAPAVLQALVEVSPWDLAAAHRAAYGALVGTAYDACLDSYGGYASYGVLRNIGAWTPYAPELAGRLSRTVCDLGGRRHWQYAAWVLRDLAASDLPQPLGGGAPGSVLHGAVSELLAAMHTPEGGGDALADRDQPALQRLRTLVPSGYSDRPHRPDLLRGIAGLLAREPLLAAERAFLLVRLVDLAVEPDAVLARLRELAAALEGAGVNVARQAAGALRTDRGRGDLFRRGGALLAAADPLARDGGTVTGLLAAGLVGGAGNALGWPEEWRAVLRLLRGHPDPDVRYEAYQRMTDAE